ncbi:ATP-dependent RNA helicase [Phytophthora cinnamomi]|uniref:ATP-dependent RNA helicase n=1 Tax=Phytophthora cinnamomi TaxID=4785 RepID=UPI00355AAF5A|nr:ATP-dependent RNA helicase [Phytophthora cinnamomi]
MASDDADLLMDDFLFHETDAFALPLLDFDPDGALLTPAELAMSQTHQQQTQTLPFPDADDDGRYQPTSPMSTDDGSTDAEVSTPPPAFVQQKLQQLTQSQLCAEMDVASSPAAKRAEAAGT